MACSGGAKVFAWIADLAHHTFGVSDQPTAKLLPRPESVLLWDRKALSHLHFFVHLGVSLDPGNLALFFGILVLLRRTGAVTRDGKVAPPLPDMLLQAADRFAALASDGRRHPAALAVHRSQSCAATDQGGVSAAAGSAEQEKDGIRR